MTTMSVIMSDMKMPGKIKASSARRATAAPAAFTLRDLNRQPAAILRACDQRGSVRIRTRDGRTYSLRLEKAPSKPEDEVHGFMERMKRHHDRMKAAGYAPPPSAVRARLNEIIAGES